MHIVSVTFSGFRSFQNGTISNLSKGINVLVGPNGAGKSSIISALEFLFTRKYSRLDSKQRQLWICNLNSNENHNNKEASVSVIIDNSDHLIPDKAEYITFKRRITAKKDQYFFNERLIKFDQICVLMTSAGFSPNHSNFIVAQGLITEIALASPEELLEILRNLSGASSFDDKKDKMMENIQLSESTLASLNTNIEEIEFKMQAMNMNSDSIKNYLYNKKVQQYLKNRISIIEHESLKASIDSKEDQNRLLKNSLESEMEMREQLKSQINFNQDLLNEWKSNIKKHECKIAIYIAMLDETQNQITKLETNLNDEERYIDNSSHLEQINESINAKTVQSRNYQKVLDDLVSKEKFLVNEITKLENARNNSYCILNMETKSIEQRKSLIEDRLSLIKEVIKVYSNLKNEHLDSIKRITNKKLNIIKQLEENSDECTSKRIKTLNNETNILKKECGGLQLSRRQNFITIQFIKQKIIDLESTLIELENHLNYVSNSAIKNKKLIEKIISSCQTRLEDSEKNQVDRDKMIVEGYFGQFIDLIELSDPRMEKAVDTLLGNKIFLHLVESSEVAIAILDEIQKMKEKPEDNISFMVLKCINPKESVYDEESEIPLYKVLKYNENLFLSVQSLCERKFVCKDLFDSNARSRPFNDYASINGDLLTSDGTFKFVSPDKSRISLYKEWKVKLEEYNLLNHELASNKLQYEQLNEQLKNHMFQININQMEIIKITKNSEDVPNFKERLNENIQLEKKVTQHIDFINLKLMNFNKEIAKLESYNCEQEKIDFNSEKIKCNELTQQINDLKLKREKVEKNCNDIEKEILETEMIIINLEKQKIQISNFNNNRKNELNVENVKWLKNQIEELTTSLKNTKDQLKVVNEQYEDALTNYNEVEQLIRPIQEKLEQKSINIIKLENEIVMINNELNKLNHQIQQLSLENDIGLLRDQMFSVSIPDEYLQLETMDQLYSCLRKIEKQILNSNINKESIEFYEQFMNEYEKNKEHKEKITRDLPRLMELIYLIENMKKNFIFRTYNLVNKNFQTIFRKLVNHQGIVRMQFLTSIPIGSANTNNNINSSGPNNNLITPLDSQISNLDNLNIIGQSLMNDSDISSLNTNFSSIASKASLISTVDDCVGIKILANFDNSNTFTELNSLSGGQKTIISTAFIFALQQIDSSPFFVFDEIDASLDATWRRSLSMMIKDLSEKKQFILSTFNPELVEQGDKFFGILNRQGLSSVNVTTKQDALNFIVRSKRLLETDSNQGSGLSHSKSDVDLSF